MLLQKMSSKSYKSTEAINAINTEFIPGKKDRRYSLLAIANQIAQLLRMFDFIRLGQWILLGILNTICLIFISAVCMWIG